MAKPPTAHELYTWTKGVETQHGPTIRDAAKYWHCTQREIRDVIEDSEASLPRGQGLSIAVAIRAGSGVYDLPGPLQIIEVY
jgi:hypothetical protein